MSIPDEGPAGVSSGPNRTLRYAGELTNPYGNVMYRDSYGRDSPMGWVVDHIKPKARGGTDTLRNLQALNTKVNLTKGDSLVKKSRHSKGNK